MIAYSKEICERKTTIFGSKGTLEVLQGEHLITHFDFATRTTHKIDCMKEWKENSPVQTVRS
jgi:hypothetical protein